VTRSDALQAIERLRADEIPFDPVAFRPLAEKLKFFETLPEARVEQLSLARYAARAALASVLRGPVRGIAVAP
jgi:hypothetical protein